MDTIWKFPFPVEDEFKLSMPEGASVLSVAMQRGVPSLWAKVSPDAPLAPHRFSVRGTGHPLGSVGEHIGTFQPTNTLVFHLFHAAPQ